MRLVWSSLLFIACASAPSKPVAEPEATGVCVPQEAARTLGATLADGPSGWLIAQPRPEGDGRFELVDAERRVTLVHAALADEPSIIRGAPDPSAQIVCAVRIPFGRPTERSIGAWDVARRAWRWAQPVTTSGIVLAGRDRCFFGDDRELVARAFDDGRELARVPLGVMGHDVARVMRGGPSDAPRLLVEQGAPDADRVHALLDGTTGALLTWFRARCADIDDAGQVTVVWPDVERDAAARAHAERKLGGALRVHDQCPTRPDPELLPPYALNGRLPWPWLLHEQRVIAHVPAGLFVWDWQTAAPKRLSPLAPHDPTDINGQHHPLRPALAPDGAWVGVIGQGAVLERWTLTGEPLPALPLPSVRGQDDPRAAAWQAFVGPLQPGGGHALALIRNTPRGRELFLGDDTKPGAWRPSNARLYDALWPEVLWPRAFPDALLLAERHFGPQLIGLDGSRRGHFAPKPVFSRTDAFLLGDDRLVARVQPASGAHDDGVYVLGLPRLDVIARHAFASPPPELAPPVGALVAHSHRDAFDLIGPSGRVTLGLIDGHGWVEQDGAARCEGAACSRYRLVRPDGSSSALTSGRCHLP